MTRHYLVLGGARSGKSRHAEDLARSHQGERIYIATAEPGDEEMRARIALHRERRGVGWRTVEEPLRLMDVLKRECGAGRVALLDCLTFWISNLMLQGEKVEPAIGQLCELVPRLEGTLVVVSNEVGLGIVPDNELARRYRDEAGFANQQLAAVCDEVVFMLAGLPLKLKG
jgi:adenosylcobinamide kinase / adenosylcobinamide-phosphate guanylyltransferase